MARAEAQQGFVKRASGRYYTGERAGRQLAQKIANDFRVAHPRARTIRAVDPFGGDGRLLEWLIDAWTELGYPKVKWILSIWDIDADGLDRARSRFAHVVGNMCTTCVQDYRLVDAFEHGLTRREEFDIVLTNPPWELLKPDRRELEGLTPSRRVEYIEEMRSYDRWLAEYYPLSQPRRKFAGWGTNLSRVGLELSLSLAKKGGFVGAVLPASLLADDQTVTLRRHLLTSHRIDSVFYYPAEAKLFENADVPSITAVFEVSSEPSTSLAVVTHNMAAACDDHIQIPMNADALEKTDYVIPVSFGAGLLSIQNKLAQRFPRWADLEAVSDGALWAGRELDETGIEKWLSISTSNAPIFLKGRMIGRYRTVENPSLSVEKPRWVVPPSVSQSRIVWRDVSRPNQKRRLIATIAEPGYVAGNSLGVAYFRSGDRRSLATLLGVMNSLCFEFQLRAYLATGHVSLSSMRKVNIPHLDVFAQEHRLPVMVEKSLKIGDEQSFEVDAYVAKMLYHLTEKEYHAIVTSFPKLTPEESEKYLRAYCALSYDEGDPLGIPASTWSHQSKIMSFAE